MDYTKLMSLLDVYKCKLDDYIWGLERSGKTAYFDKENGLPGLRIGSCRSAFTYPFATEK